MQVLLFPKIIGWESIAVATTIMAKKSRPAWGRNHITPSPARAWPAQAAAWLWLCGLCQHITSLLPHFLIFVAFSTI